MLWEHWVWTKTVTLQASKTNTVSIKRCEELGYNVLLINLNKTFSGWAVHNFACPSCELGGKWAWLNAHSSKVKREESSWDDTFEHICTRCSCMPNRTWGPSALLLAPSLIFSAFSFLYKMFSPSPGCGAIQNSCYFSSSSCSFPLLSLHVSSILPRQGRGQCSPVGHSG